MKRYLLLALAGLAFAAPAQAEDFPMMRIEANLGWDHIIAKADYRNSASPEDNFGASRNTDGIIYGATVGFDIPVGVAYLGIEGSADLASNKRCGEVFGDDRLCFKAKRNFALGGRAGLPMSKRTLAYVGAAWVNGRARVSYRDNLDPSNNIAFSDNRDGFRLSGGLEHRLQNNVYTKLEYRYSEYGSYKISDGVERASLGFERHQVVAGVGVRF